MNTIAKTFDQCFDYKESFINKDFLVFVDCVIKEGFSKFIGSSNRTVKLDTSSDKKCFNPGDRVDQISVQISFSFEEKDGAQIGTVIFE